MPRAPKFFAAVTTMRPSPDPRSMKIGCGHLRHVEQPVDHGLRRRHVVHVQSRGAGLLGQHRGRQQSRKRRQCKGNRT
jgi:hypothetical protein